MAGPQGSEVQLPQPTMSSIVFRGRALKDLGFCNPSSTVCVRGLRAHPEMTTKLSLLAFVWSSVVYINGVRGGLWRGMGKETTGLGLF